MLAASDGKIAGIDLGLKDFAIVGAKYAHAKYLRETKAQPEKKTAKTSQKKKGSKSREKVRKLVARIYERILNARQDYLHKSSRKRVDDNQVIVVESLNTKATVRNHKLAKAVSNLGWEMFVNFLHYKLEHEGKTLVEIDRYFPSFRLCWHCHYQVSQMSLDVRTWVCLSCGTHYDKDSNAAINITAEGIRM